MPTDTAGARDTGAHDAPASVDIVFSQASASADNNPEGTTTTVAFMHVLQAGDLIVLCLDYDFDPSVPPAPAIADSQGNAYTLAIGPGTTSGYAQRLYYAFAAAPGADQLTVALGTPDKSFLEARLVTYRGASALDDTSIAAGAVGGSDAIVDAAPVTAQVAGELILGCEVGDPGTSTVGAESTLRSDLDADVVEDRFAPTPGSYVETADTSSDSLWTFTVASFR